MCVVTFYPLPCTIYKHYLTFCCQKREHTEFECYAFVIDVLEVGVSGSLPLCSALLCHLLLPVARSVILTHHALCVVNMYITVYVIVGEYNFIAFLVAMYVCVC